MIINCLKIVNRLLNDCYMIVKQLNDCGTIVKRLLNDC